MEKTPESELGTSELETELEDTDTVPDESPEETAERIFNQEWIDNDSDDEEPAAAAAAPQAKGEAQVQEPKGKGGKGKQQPQLKPDLDLVPPEAFTSQERQEFDALPPEQKRATARLVKSLKARQDREFNELQKNNRYARSIWEAVAPFAEEWGTKGVTLPQGITRLAAAHKKLTHPDQGTREKHFLELAHLSGIDVVLRSQAQEVEGTPDISTHPVFQKQQEEINRLRQSLEPVLSNHEQLVRGQHERQVQTLVSDYEAVRSEIDPVTGGSKFPELYNLEREAFSHFESVVNGLMMSARSMRRNLSKQDAIRSTYQSIFGPVSRHQQSNQAAPQQNRRAQAANVSARGHSTATNGKSKTEIPPEALADPLATAEYFFNNAR